MAKIKTQGEYRYGNKFTYAVATLSFDENGVAEVSDDLVEALLEADGRLSLVENKKEDPLAEKRKELEALTVKDLKEIAESIPDADKAVIEKLKKSELVDFLIEKV